MLLMAASLEDLQHLMHKVPEVSMEYCFEYTMIAKNQVPNIYENKRLEKFQKYIYLGTEFNDQ